MRIFVSYQNTINYNTTFCTLTLRELNTEVSLQLVLSFFSDTRNAVNVKLDCDCKQVIK